MKNVIHAIVAFLSISILLSIAASAQRGGRVGAGFAPPPRRTGVVAAIATERAPGDRLHNPNRRDWGRPGYGYQGTHPGAVGAVAVARRVPIGTVITELPVDCSMTFISEMEYYYCSGQYYQPMGTETSPIYVAAEPYIPDAYVPDASIPDISIPDIHVPGQARRLLRSSSRLLYSRLLLGR